MVATELDPHRLDGLFRIGVDEISWRRHHKYLTLVIDHDSGKVIWGAKDRTAVTLEAFFDDLGETKTAAIKSVSMRTAPAGRLTPSAHGAGRSVTTLTK